MSMQTLLLASQSITRMQAMQSAKSQMQSTADILRVESKLDGGNEKKLAKADELEKKANDLTEDLMGEITDVNEALKPDEDTKAEEAEKEEEALNKKTDTITLSAAAKQLSKNNLTKPVVLEAVTYKADGSTTPSAPTKSAPTFEATA